MQTDKTESQKEAVALPESKKLQRRAALAEIKRLHAGDPAQAREAARLWFEQNAEPVAAGTVEVSAFHRRKLNEADPQRAQVAAEGLKQREAEAEKAQTASRAAVKEWRKRNPNKVKKLGKLFKEGLKSKKPHK
jgi:hypothetical protein